MSTTDFIPRSDPEFNLWQNNLVTESEANMIPWGLTEPDLAPVKILKTKWESAFLAASNKQNRTSAEVQAKGDARGVYEPALRNFVAEFLANNRKVSDADRTRLGITVRSESRTASPVPASSPVGRVDFSVLLQHTVNFSDEATPTSRAKPTGVHGCEIWMKVGEGSGHGDRAYLFGHQHLIAAHCFVRRERCRQKGTLPPALGEYSRRTRPLEHPFRSNHRGLKARQLCGVPALWGKPPHALFRAETTALPLPEEVVIVK